MANIPFSDTYSFESDITILNLKTWNATACSPDVNYQVQPIEGLVQKLKENGVTIPDSIATCDYGKFIHIIDAESNKIELWSPLTTKGATKKREVADTSTATFLFFQTANTLFNGSK